MFKSRNSLAMGFVSHSWHIHAFLWTLSQLLPAALLGAIYIFNVFEKKVQMFTNFQHLEQWWCFVIKQPHVSSYARSVRDVFVPKILGWPKSSFWFFHKMLQKNLKELSGQLIQGWGLPLLPPPLPCPWHGWIFVSSLHIPFRPPCLALRWLSQHHLFSSHCLGPLPNPWPPTASSWGWN